MTDEQIEAIWLRVTGFDAAGDKADIIGFARAIEREMLKRAATECVRTWEIGGNAWACAVAVCSLKQSAKEPR